MKKSFFMSREDPILPTANARALRASATVALADWGTKSREPAGPAGETGSGAVTFSVTAPPARADASPHQSRFEEAAPCRLLPNVLFMTVLAGFALYASVRGGSFFVFSSHPNIVVGVVLGLLALWLLPPTRRRVRSHRQHPESRCSQPARRRAVTPLA